MIVQSMTPQEVYSEIDREIDRMWAWRQHTYKSVAKRARQMMKFPQVMWYDHESSRHNRYLCMNIILDRNFSRNSIRVSIALQKMEHGWAVYYFGWPGQEKFDRMVLLPHVFDRYAERADVQKTGIELIKHFIRYNTDGWCMRDNRFSGRSVRYNGRDNRCMSLHDGVLLGETIDNIFVARTFITYDMATGLQGDAFEERRARLRTQYKQSDIINKLK